MLDACHLASERFCTNSLFKTPPKNQLQKIQKTSWRPLPKMPGSWFSPCIMVHRTLFQFNRLDNDHDTAPNPVNFQQKQLKEKRSASQCTVNTQLGPMNHSRSQKIDWSLLKTKDNANTPGKHVATNIWKKGGYVYMCTHVCVHVPYMYTHKCRIIINLYVVTTGSYLYYIYIYYITCTLSLFFNIYFGTWNYLEVLHVPGYMSCTHWYLIHVQHVVCRVGIGGRLEGWGYWVLSGTVDSK